AVLHLWRFRDRYWRGAHFQPTGDQALVRLTPTFTDLMCASTWRIAPMALQSRESTMTRNMLISAETPSYHPAYPPPSPRTNPIFHSKQIEEAKMETIVKCAFP
ncbi:hypothetical protein BN1723_000908, partial [Verticillium longisporum]